MTLQGLAESRILQQQQQQADGCSARHHSTIEGLIPLSLAITSAAILFFTFSARQLRRCLKRRRRRAKLIQQHGGQVVAMPNVVIEDEQEHGMLESQDLMLEAENAVIRRAVKQQGIVWPGAFRALGSLKEKPDHHRKPDNDRNKYLAVPRVAENGQEDDVAHDGDSWVQFWKSPRDAAMRKMRKERERFSWRVTFRRLWRNGKKDFIQALLAWSLVGILWARATLARHHHHPAGHWAVAPAVAWVGGVASASACR